MNTSAPPFVTKNLASIYSASRKLGCSYLDIQLATGIPAFNIGAIVFEFNSPYKPKLPDKDTYNKLAAFFDWEVWK